MATASPRDAPVPGGALRRHSPEVGAQCGNSARWDLCGGPPARAVPTATAAASDTAAAYQRKLPAHRGQARPSRLGQVRPAVQVTGLWPTTSHCWRPRRGTGKLMVSRFAICPVRLPKGPLRLLLRQNDLICGPELMRAASLAALDCTRNPCWTARVGRKVLPGSAAPLGALFDGQGTNFAIYAAGAARVWLCLFDAAHASGEERVELTEVDAYVWHCYLPGIAAGQRYAYRVAGDWDPDHGKRWNVAKLLLDPYALAVDGPLNWGASDADAERLFDYRFADGSRSDLDSAPGMPRCVVVDRSFDWGDREARPHRELADTVIYEIHVRAFTCQHPGLAPAEQGTYKGLTHPDVLKYLSDLGVTAVELMPVQQFFSNRGETNFWGYNPVCWMAPHGAYALAGRGGEQVAEFKEMVRVLHEAGFEVFLDVVFNHTVEGGNPQYLQLKVHAGWVRVRAGAA